MKQVYVLSLMASRREAINDAILSSCLLWFCCMVSMTSVNFSSYFSMDLMLLLSETFSSVFRLVFSHNLQERRKLGEKYSTEITEI